DVRGGALLGLVMGLKLMAWPILIFLALRRRWAAVTAGISIAMLTNVIALLLMDFQTVAHYYSAVGKTVFMIYKAAQYNISTWTIGWKVFDGMGTWVDYTFQAPPLVHLPTLAWIISIALPTAVLIGGLVLASKARNLDTSFAILVCVSVLVN